MDLSGKTAIITGAASGIGAAVAETLAKAGASGICLADIDIPGAEQVASRLGCPSLVVENDVRASDSVKSMVAATVNRFGTVDILVNNAGVAPVVRWPDVTEENWRDVLDINLNGAFHCLLHVMEQMKTQRWGRVINISSVGAFKGSITAHPAYGVSKAGLIAMTKSAAKELAEFGILVNSVSPGTIDTPLTQNNFTPEEQAMFVEDSVLKRRGSPFEIADAVLFLASERSTYITGATIHVNGGSLLV